MNAIMQKVTPLKITVLYVVLVFVKRTNSVLVTETGVNEEEQNTIVDLHNAFRLKLQTGQVPKQPRSIDIKRMCWDDTLAEEAQKIANTTKFEHVDVRDTRWNFVGQNLAQSASTWEKEGADWNWAVTSWQDEVSLYKYGDPPSQKTGHYTQTAWAETTHVGCGYVGYVDPHQRLKYKQFYVCNYGPAGNINGRSPYKTGRCGCKGLCRTGIKSCKPKSKKNATFLYF